MTRAEAAKACICSVCSIGRLNGSDYIRYKTVVSEPVGHPRVNPPPSDPAPKVVCSLCHSSYGPGLSHDCSPNVKKANVEEIVRQNSEKTKSRIISSQLK